MGRRPNPTKLTDKEAKEILLRWHDRTTIWNGPTEENRWLKAQPVDGRAVGPRLLTSGAQLFRNQPDGMWVLQFGADREQFADVIAIEVCGTIQNLNDKRARYMSSTASLQLRCTVNWLAGGAERYPNWAVAGFTQRPTESLSFAVRHARVSYAPPGEIYEKWRSHGILAGHEFMCLHSSLQTYTSQKMQDFLSRIAPSAHYYIQM